MAYGGSNDDVIDVEGQGRDPNIFKAHYFENSSR